MTIKRLVLVALTAIALLFMGADLVASLGKPQFQGRLTLFESDLRLHFVEWQGQPDSTAQALRELLGESRPVESALEEYTAAKTLAADNLSNAQKELTQLKQADTTSETILEKLADKTRSEQIADLEAQVNQKQKNQDELDLRLGLLYRIKPKATTEDLQKSAQLWQNLQESPTTSPNLADTAAVLSGLWQTPPQLLPQAERLIQQNLDGWYRYRSLERVYELSQQKAELSKLNATEQETAERVITQLGFSSLLSALTFVGGSVLLLTLGVQRLLRGQKSLLAGIQDSQWAVPWDWETTWWVVIVGFFFVGQFLAGNFLVPIATLGLKSALGPLISRDLLQALSILVGYLCLAGGASTVLYQTLKPHFPLEKNWFRLSLQGNWWLWGLGSYLVVFPLVVGVNLINQAIWQGKGGSNPLLEILLNGQDPLALVLFFVTTSIAAPIFEEFFFRGFLLPSLTRYVSPWNAILLSSLIFALVHLSLSEVLPLATLGIVLGFVYTRTQNLLASIVLHSLWNSGTLISLFILGNASRG
ncbi:type II CAAX endopeptidase family protein [Alkalinema sp. FACHB-956]|uniref:CPBP family intramembrane glutamic endopeptidase n=1 Tax=Alkalinema sp. FACHB-956 TaxID=2692768 RepID=UPI001684086D|nr:type II CAAX endopeptidase family protein [Alkalinema sp. FACHB-956]MBD2329823.1 CPBP family intramembrane metalloprotease [Alkalinema sp. FACHB-956]